MQIAQAQQKPIASHGGIRPRTYGLVLHVQVGNGSLAGYFGNPANNVSSAYWLAKDGRIEQYFDDSLIGWTQADGNSSWIAVETEGDVDEPLTEAQLNGMAVLLYLTSREYGFPIQNTDDVSGRGLGHHAMGGVAWGNHPCPGPIRIAQKAEIVRRALSIAGNGISSAALGGTQLSEEDDMFTDNDRGMLTIARDFATRDARTMYAIRDDDGNVYALGVNGWSYLTPEQLVWFDGQHMFEEGCPEQVNNRARDLLFMVSGRGDNQPAPVPAPDIDYKLLADAVVASLAPRVEAAVKAAGGNADPDAIAKAVVDLEAKRLSGATV